MAKYKLMIKTHNVTGLKYLCITKKENWPEYLGSGKYWRNHLISHGPDIRTELLYRAYVEENKVYDVIQCPHCGKMSSPDKRPSAFLRWHLDNCRLKETV